MLCKKKLATQKKADKKSKKAQVTEKALSYQINQNL